MHYEQFISPQTQFHRFTDSFSLELGGVLLKGQIAYRTWGRLNRSRNNAVLVCHAFTGWADLEAWWQPLLGAGKALDPDRDFIICSNILGSCYGTTGPSSIDPQTGKPYGTNFPAINVRDMVRLQARLLDALGVESLQMAIGGSLGGMQVLEWAALYPERVKSIAVIAASGRHSAWCIGLSEAQRQAIYADPLWQNGNYDPAHPPAQGLAVARMIAMHTYRSWQSFNDRFGRTPQSNPQATSQPKIHQPQQNQFSIASYLNYQGDKLVERFDANTYVALSQAMDRHDLTRSPQSYEAVLKGIQQPSLVVAIDSDILYPPIEQEELAHLIPNAELAWLYSPHGHDAFLIEMDELNNLVVQFRQRAVRTRLNGHYSEPNHPPNPPIISFRS
ncbi:homoserine O-acetyltransferase MetX [Leptolyngbya ohadii]|uniref:homoserine O-acetyltransferase MetX n=1 Tax=Leptolyngbya ohadii TaxID=1962290 RepID=UPI000B5A1F3C|nr:homoserine O-acetyltransferase [Leptolyngbya ohadii]